MIVVVVVVVLVVVVVAAVVAIGIRQSHRPPVYVYRRLELPGPETRFKLELLLSRINTIH